MDFRNLSILKVHNLITLDSQSLTLFLCSAGPTLFLCSLFPNFVDSTMEEIATETWSNLFLVEVSTSMLARKLQHTFSHPKASGISAINC